MRCGRISLISAFGSRLDTAERCQEISQGYAVFAYPWIKRADETRIPTRMRGILAPPPGCGSCPINCSRWYATNAYHRLISYHRSPVNRRFPVNLLPPLRGEQDVPC